MTANHLDWMKFISTLYKETGKLFEWSYSIIINKSLNSGTNQIQWQEILITANLKKVSVTIQ